MNAPVVLITGALTGIGRATAIAFAKEGARIVVSGRRDEEGRLLADALQAMGVQAAFIRADVRFEDDVRKLIDETVARYGHLDVAINNAGTEGKLAPIAEQSVENYEGTFATNVLGTLLSVKHEMRVMLAQGAGTIVNISSVAGTVGIAGASVYVASKHAVEGITKSAALEGAAAGVRVNAVAPGPVETSMLDRFTGGSSEAKSGFLSSIPAKRAADVDEIAQTIVFLANDKARYLTGQSIGVDGGYTAQ